MTAMPYRVAVLDSSYCRQIVFAAPFLSFRAIRLPAQITPPDTSHAGRFRFFVLQANIICLSLSSLSLSHFYADFGKLLTFPPLKICISQLFFVSLQPK